VAGKETAGQNMEHILRTVRNKLFRDAYPAEQNRNW